MTTLGLFLFFGFSILLHVSWKHVAPAVTRCFHGWSINSREGGVQGETGDSFVLLSVSAIAQVLSQWLSVDQTSLRCCIIQTEPRPLRSLMCQEGADGLLMGWDVGRRGGTWRECHDGGQIGKHCRNHPPLNLLRPAFLGTAWWWRGGHATGQNGVGDRSAVSPARLVYVPTWIPFRSPKLEFPCSQPHPLRASVGWVQ